MEKFPNEDFYGVMFTYASYHNQKFQHYWQRFSEKCAKSELFIYPQAGRFSLFSALYQFNKKFPQRQFNNIFVASIDDLFVQTFISQLQFNLLCTFDDGTANIVQNSIYYQDSSQSIVRKMANLVLGNKYSTQKLRQLSQKHYSIYPNMPNIVENIELVSLSNSVEQNSAKFSEKPPLALLLGQPLYEDNQQNIALVERVVEQFGIELYLPHPRESFKTDKVKYIETPLIFEDYISQQSQQQKYRIYTYFSGAVLNVLNNPNIEVISIKPNLTNPTYLACYPIFEKFRVKVIELDK
ncbi:glycosyltransferase family 52 [Haemophilus paracuniculus]|nr:glycosyltransferase family 52 [Haemophilus paracuniculus]